MDEATIRPTVRECQEGGVKWRIVRDVVPLMAKMIMKLRTFVTNVGLPNPTRMLIHDERQRTRPGHHGDGHDQWNFGHL